MMIPATGEQLFITGQDSGLCPSTIINHPTGEGESLLPMLLFSDRTNWDPDILENAIALFQHRVYAFQKD